MSSPASLRSAAAPCFPLAGYASADAIAAYCRGKPVTAGRFLADVARAAEALPEARHMLNACADRYRFTVVVCAAIVRGQTTLLPASTTPNVVQALRRFAHDAYFVSDDPQCRIDLPRFELPAQPEEADGAAFAIPAIPGDQVVACLFTSGSTGEPQPHFKTWGSMVRDMRAGIARLGITPRHAILGTVPPQHMFGFESTVFLPLARGAALTSERPYYPVEVDEAVLRLPAPRMLVTTPFHLRAWMDGGNAARIETVLSATAPLPVGLAREVEARTGARLFEIYGCTEAGQVATRQPTRSLEWQPFDGLRVWNEAGQAMVAGGHVDRPTPLQDIIEVTADGARFILHGRTADMVNIAGKRNSIGYLDHQLASIPGVVDGAFYLPDEADAHGVTRLMAFVVAPGLDAAQILEGLRSRVDAAFLPRPLVIVERLPRALTGKLPREALARLAEQARER